MAIQDVGSAVDQVEVRIGPQFLNLFSEHLYSSPNKAFEELVSNSWDAGARRVYVSVPENLQDDEAAIWVLDDGGSMDVEGFRALWSVATSSKRAVEGADARRPIGKFGVGKLATYLLAHELTYVCKAADGVVRAVTMDYRRIDDDPKKTALHIDPVPLSVRVLSSVELAALLEAIPNGARARQLVDAGIPGEAIDSDFVDEFGGKEPDPPQKTGTWTLAVMSSLKGPGRKLSVGWVKRLLRTALPLGNTISIYFNDEPLTSAKSNIDVVNEWVIGEGLKLGTLSLPDGEVIAVEEHASPYPHLQIEGIGPVTGRFRLYSDRISGGKSENIEVSNGFFINIRGRVIKPEDPYFGLDNLSHSVWARFRATIRADGLDSKLSVNRESISDSRELRIFRAFLMKLFNKARVDYDARTAAEWPDVGAVLTEKWGVLPFEPLRRVVTGSLGGGGFEIPSFIQLNSKSDIEAVSSAWEKATLDAPAEMITDVVVSELETSDRLSHYDVENRRVIVNKNHPFAVEHQDSGQELRLLRDAALVDLLTDAFMTDIGLSIDQTTEIRDYKDRAYRLVAQVRRRSAAQIASLLIGATGHAKGFERIIGDALEFIGFAVQRLGASGEPEGVATAIASPAEGDTRVTYKFTYDAKSSVKGVVKTSNVGIAGLARHRTDYDAQHTLVVAPAFEEGALEQECEQNGITPINAADLARLVLLTVGYGQINLVEFRKVFSLFRPGDVSAWVEQLIETQRSTKHLSLGLLIQALTAISEANPNRPDMIHCSLIADKCRDLLEDNNFPNRNQVAAAIRGLSLMAPNVISISTSQDVFLNAPPTKIGELIAAQVNAIPQGYRYGIARGIES
ncbi:MAG: ATP-binding protein [Pseudomonadota bacterium]|jgi:hypothetical protein